MNRQSKLRVNKSTVIYELAVSDEEMHQIIRIKNEVNKLKRKRRWPLASDFDHLEVYNTSLPFSDEIVLILKGLTKAKDVMLFSYNSYDAQDGLTIIDIDNITFKVSAK